MKVDDDFKKQGRQKHSLKCYTRPVVRGFLLLKLPKSCQRMFAFAYDIVPQKGASSSISPLQLYYLLITVLHVP